jgi:hypothetical protein
MANQGHMHCSGQPSCCILLDRGPSSTLRNSIWWVAACMHRSSSHHCCVFTVQSCHAVASPCSTETDMQSPNPCMLHLQMAAHCLVQRAISKPAWHGVSAGHPS